MTLKIKRVVAKPEYRLLVIFSNGEKRVLDMSQYLNKGIFKELKNERYFKKVRPIACGIEWPHEQDLSIDTLYHQGTSVGKPNKPLKRNRLRRRALPVR